MIRGAVFLIVICLAAGARAAAPVEQVIVQDGSPALLEPNLMLGEQVVRGGYLAIQSSKAGIDHVWGSHYISIGLLARTLHGPGAFHVTVKAGLLKLNDQPGPVTLSVKIGSQWYDIAFESGQVTVKGVWLDAVRYEAMDQVHEVPVVLDGNPFSLEFVRDATGGTRIWIDGRLLQQFWVEAGGGDLGLCIERKNLLRNPRSPEVAVELRLYEWRATAAFGQRSDARGRWEKLVGDRRLMKRVGNAYAFVEDDPGRPNVLLIGDSISIYYTDPVRRLLAGRADVYRTPMAPGKAAALFTPLAAFLKERKWDVIHFNTGLHDFAGQAGSDADLAQYRRNLEQILARLQATGARVIWASTTPVPEKAPAVTSDDLAKKYNAVAKALMHERNIPIDDLYAAVKPQHDRYWAAPNNVHFNEAGSAFLGREVANCISRHLPWVKSNPDDPNRLSRLKPR
jgi:acyl-CoA thioesterase-1